jgi:23S rRNA pseudouridine1911/1915/1917 synthase
MQEMKREDLKVLYEDNHLIVVYKPAGVLVQGDDTGDINLMDVAKEYLKEKYAKPGNVFLGLVHRLDRPVAGIVIYAKTSKGAARISEQFRDNEVEKIYFALVEGELEKPVDTLKNYISKDEIKKKASVFDEPGEGRSIAILSYEIIKSNKDFSLLKIKLETGRFHQIRAQLSHIGYPILGDIKYGAAKALSDRSIGLIAGEISFKTATTGEMINLKIEVPSSLLELVEHE